MTFEEWWKALREAPEEQWKIWDPPTLAKMAWDASAKNGEAFAKWVRETDNGKRMRLDLYPLVPAKGGMNVLEKNEDD